MKSTIGLYGGSFDPVHTGHVSIAQSFLASGFINELWILLTPVSPHKHNQPVGYNHRFEMLKLAFRDFKSVQILTIENELPKPSYTYKTIQHLRSNYPELEFKYCIGEDSLAGFDSWKHPELILKEVDLLVAKRPGNEKTEISTDIADKATFVDHTPIEISSTEIKLAIAGNKSIERLVDPKVESYIRTNKLYL